MALFDSTSSTATAGLDMLGSTTGMIPGVGAGISSITSLISGILKNEAAREQEVRATELRRKSEGLQKQALRPEYIKALKMNEMAALYGMPELNKYEQKIDEDIANNARAIVQGSPDGGVALNAINSTLNKAYQAKNQLYQQDALMKADKMSKLSDRVWATGDKQMDLVDMQRADKRDLNIAAGNLENAATANKTASIDQILSTIGATGNTIGLLGQNGTGGRTGLTSANLSGKTDETGAMGTSTIDPKIVAAIMALKKSNPELFSQTNPNGFWSNQSTFQSPTFSLTK